jgi:hypothetical protein
VPKTTVAQAVTKNKLLSTSAPSRETGANRPPCFNDGDRHANKASPPPTNTTRIANMKMPRIGSLAKACTEVTTPERTRNVPTSDSENARMASRMVQTLRALRFSITTAE